MNDTVKWEKEEILAYLDGMIEYWRAKKQIAFKMKPRDAGKSKHTAGCYVDAYQSVRISLFGELKPVEPTEKYE